jgi:serine/threonine protein kinase
VEYKSSWIEKNYKKQTNFEAKYVTTKDITSGHKIFNSNYTYLLHIQMELCLKSLIEVIVQLDSQFNSKNLLQINYYILSELLKEILESVDFLHKENIIHRDLKPANILITNGINGRFIKIADFGLSVIHELPDQSHTQDSGTIKYMAPEVSNSRKYDMKADIYSLGVIIQDLFHLNPDM